ncbi:fimbrial protein [Utexia brackfieldae]|uniref:fimbrial protein n=1 Tax=Utexia brackfieldae TaxID=3074108 RepID=UPI00370DB85B
MKKYLKMNKQVWSILLLILFTGYHSMANATCVRVAPAIDAGCDACGVSPGFGKVNLTNSYLQPVGSILATSIFDFTTGVRYPDPNKVLYQCDVSDIGQIYEQFVTNADDRVGGFFDLGATDGNPNFFATYFPYVGIKLTHMRSGTVFTRNYQSVPLTSYETVGTKINIRVKDLSPIKAELIRLSTLPPTTGALSNFCGGMASTTAPDSYTCIQPNGYVIFVGPGIAGEVDGSDGGTNYSTWFTGRWNAIGMGTSPRPAISYASSCAVRNVTPIVVFPTVSDVSLNAGNTVQGDLTITLECDDKLSPSDLGMVMLGLQTSYPTYLTEQNLGLVNANGGMKYLLSDDYDTETTVAKGVGITLTHTASGTPMNFVGWSNCTTAGCPTTTESGWYPALYAATAAPSKMAGYAMWTTQLTASLTKIPGMTVVPGKVKATAYVLARVQ